MKHKWEQQVKKTLAAQSEALRGLGRTIATKGFSRAVELLMERNGKIVVTGVGKSGFIGMKMSATLTSLGHQAIFLHPVEALHGDVGVVTDTDVIIAISFSGESQEVLRIARHLKQSFSISLIILTGNSTSKLASMADACVAISIKDEGSPLNLAPMASTMATQAIGDLLASAVTSSDRFEAKHFAKFHPAGKLGLSLVQVRDVMSSGASRPIALENATFEKALVEMNKKGLGVVGVVDKNKHLVGVITDGDIRRILIRYKDPKRMLIREVMTRNPRYVQENDTLKDALSIMEQHKVTNLFVTDTKKAYRGVIHVHDIIESTL